MMCVIVLLLVSLLLVRCHESAEKTDLFISDIPLWIRL